MKSNPGRMGLLTPWEPFDCGGQFISSQEFFSFSSNSLGVTCCYHRGLYKETDSSQLGWHIPDLSIMEADECEDSLVYQVLGQLELLRCPQMRGKTNKLKSDTLVKIFWLFLIKPEISAFYCRSLLDIYLSK